MATSATTLVIADQDVAIRRSGRLIVVGSYAFICLILLIVVFANLLAPHDPNKQHLDQALLPMSHSHWFGTDDLGRDVFSRMLVGTRASVLSSLLAVGVGLVIGLPIGIVAGYRGGWFDAVSMRIIDALLSFPSIVLAIGMTATLGPSIRNAMIAVGIVLAPVFCRVVRAQVLVIRDQTFVEAARSFGARGVRRMVLPHIVPNVIQPVLVQVSVRMGYALIAEASLSFLSLGVQPPNSSWGTVLSRAYTFMDRAPMQVFIPGIAIAATVFCLNVIGDDLQRVLDPKRRR